MSIDLGKWEEFKDIVKNYLETRDISTFPTWDILNRTMIANVDQVEIDYIEKKFDYWRDKMEESILKPNSHNIYKTSSTNNLHHIYSLQVMIDNLNVDLSDFSTVTEFGGGYGNVARIFRKCGFKGDYRIYDIPEFCKIQDFYLKQNSINDIYLLSKDDKINKVDEKSLFIGLWSITETPIETRQYYIDNLKILDHDNIFIAMGDYFYDENNMSWLNDTIIPQLNEKKYMCQIIKIEHGNGMYYFCAKRQATI